MQGDGHSLRITLPAVLGFAALSVLVVGVGGDFPLHDDWVHMHEVAVLHEEGRYDGAPILTSTFIAQGLWGALFTKIFGLDYVTLRIATLVLAALGTLAMAHSALALGASRTVALLAAAGFWFMPLVLPLAFTFNTDVPFASLLLMGGCFALRSLATLRARTALAALALLWAACFVRQHGIVVLGAYAAVLLAGSSLGARYPRRFLAAVAGGFAAGGAVALLWISRGAANAEQLAWLDHLRNVLTREWLREALRYAALAFSFAGLLLAPLALLRVTGLAGPAHGRRRLLCALVAGMAAAGIVSSHAILPIGHDVLHDFGMGWRSLTADASATGSPAPQRLGAGAWIALTILGALSASVLLGTAIDAVLGWRERTDDGVRARQALFLAWWALLFFASLLPFLPRTADRYLIPVIAPLALLATLELRPATAGARRPVALVIAVSLAATIGYGSLAGTQDYLAWNRARWQALGELLATVPANEIDGGFEFNGVYTREAYRRLHGRTDDHLVGQRGFWVVADRYALAFAPRAGFAVERRYQYFSWLGFTSRELLVLRRTTAVPPNPPRTGGEPWDAAALTRR